MNHKRFLSDQMFEWDHRIKIGSMIKTKIDIQKDFTLPKGSLCKVVEVYQPLHAVSDGGVWAALPNGEIFGFDWEEIELARQ